MTLAHAQDPLPYRGLGLSSNLQTTDVPNPYRLLDAEPGLLDFVEYSAPLALEEARQEASLFDEMWRRRASVPVLFHPVHLNLYGPTLEAPGALRALSEHALAVGSAWVGNDVGWWHEAGRPFPGYLYLAPPMTEAGLADAVAHARHVQSHLAVPLLLENPAVFRRTGPLHVLDFMAALHAKTGCELLIDLGHLFSFQLAHGHAPQTGFDGFPWEAVRELHLAGGVVTWRGGRGTYADDHTQPVRQELFELLAAVRPRCTRLRAFTFEGDGHPPAAAAATLRALRRWVEPPASSGEAVPPRGTAPLLEAAPFAPQSRPWELFSEAHGQSPAPGDPDGQTAELDFRLAVVAELLDRAWPLSRLACAGTREGLLRFLASDGYRASFAPGGPSLAAAFGRFAARAATGERDTGRSALVAFETWARALPFKGPVPVAPNLVTAPGVRVGTFAVDLEECLFGARALRRHLEHRAWGSGCLEPSGLEGLLQAARRAPQRAWRVLVRPRLGEGVEVRSLPSGPLEPLGLAQAVEEGWLVR